MNLIIKNLIMKNFIMKLRKEFQEIRLLDGLKADVNGGQEH